MGFFGRLFGGRGRKPKSERILARGTAGGAPLTDENVTSGPFPRELRLRAVYEDYNLFGKWQVITLQAASEWPSAREAVLHAYYTQFGLIRLADGTQTIRWNETIWRGIRDTLEIRYDPSHARAAASSPQ